jgi:hypothetical protein
MSGRIRWVVPNRLYESTMRTVDRQFLFKPNHHPENPLLANSSLLNALDMRNDIIPEPSIINIIGAAVGRAIERYPVRIHCFEASINHIHEKCSATEEQVGNLAGFMRCVHSLILGFAIRGHGLALKRRISRGVAGISGKRSCAYAFSGSNWMSITAFGGDIFKDFKK